MKNSFFKHFWLKLLCLIIFTQCNSKENIAQSNKETKNKAMNGFELSDASIPVDEILSGGPQRDGIPSIDSPKFQKIDEENFYKDNERILGIYRNGAAKAYPIKIMNWHEIVNDDFGAEKIVITYCPLCGSGMAFEANIAGQNRTFGVSGLLYNSDVLLYDRETESLWSQLLFEAVSGESKGEKLTAIILENTTIKKWKEKYPESLILTTETGFTRDYAKSPYGNYNIEEKIIFPVSHQKEDYHPKTIVIGVERNGVFKAYPWKEIKNMELIQDKINGKEIIIEVNKKAETALIKNNAGEAIPSIRLFWFAWIAFHPNTEVYKK